MKTFKELNEGLFSSKFKSGLISIGAKILSSGNDMGFKFYDIELNGKFFRVSQEPRNKYSAFQITKNRGAQVSGGIRTPDQFDDLNILKNLSSG